jgi:hypothetical protein
MRRMIAASVARRIALKKMGRVRWRWPPLPTRAS